MCGQTGNHDSPGERWRHEQALLLNGTGNSVGRGAEYYHKRLRVKHVMDLCMMSLIGGNGKSMEFDYLSMEGYGMQWMHT